MLGLDACNVGGGKLRKEIQGVQALIASKSGEGLQ